MMPRNGHITSRNKSARKAMAFRAENILLLQIMALQVQKRLVCWRQGAV
jgi:hypothetical protein